LLQSLSDMKIQAKGDQLGGYNFSRTGQQVWSAN